MRTARYRIKPKIVRILLCGCVWTALSVATFGQNTTTGKVADPLQSNMVQSATDSMQRQESLQEPDTALPAAQLIQVLQSNPEVMVEVKSLVADLAQQQGLSVQADALTDQQVFAQIEASKNLRASLTQFLRARGYLSEQDIELTREKSMHESVRIPCNGEDCLEDAQPKRHTLTDNPYESTPGTTVALPRDNSTDKLRQTLAQQTEFDKVPAANVTDEPRVLHRTTPYNLLSLRDLYTQIPNSPEHLKRFGSEVFVTRNAPGMRPLTQGAESAMGALDVPVGPDYVLGPGDELSISLWGGISQSLLRLVDREGKLTLPDAGVIQVAGLSIANAQRIITEALQAQYRDIHVAVTVSHLRSVRIFVVGDVQRPGSYEVSALASPISALFAAGGPTAVGSLRILRHYRNQKFIGEIDLYDFMLHGIRPGDDRLQGGDTLLVPPVGPQVAIFGAVKRPAIYELKDEKDLSAVLDDAGGLTVAAALSQITIDRVVANQYREEVSVSVDPAMESGSLAARLHTTEVKDGDRIRVGMVLPYNERVIYLQGHVSRPGKVAYRDNLRIEDVLHSYQDLLPEPANRGEIVRLVPPDLHPETIAFSVPDVLAGNATVSLHPFDTIRIFGRYEEDSPTVTIRGEVQRPGIYPLFQGMTAAQLVRTAGGFKRDALIERADLASYQIVKGTRVSTERRDVAIGDAVLKRDNDADTPLKPGDVLTVHQLTGWNDIGASIIIEGEVAHPGSYGFEAGEHLSDVLRRAGGLRATAYPEGAVLTRPEVASLEQKSRDELIRQIETSSAAARLSPATGSGDQSTTMQMIQQQQDQILARLRSQPASGRLVIHIGSSIESWAGTAADIEVRSGDVLRIPKRPGFVLVSGQVYNPSAISYMPGKTAGWYLERAGGASSIANRKEIFVIRANGDVVGRRSSSWYEHDVLSTRLNAGDTIVVPQKIIGPSVTWRNLLGTAQIAASLAIAASVAGL